MKKCVVCEDETAILRIKDTSDFYCQECAEENFDDISVLVPIEESA